MVWIKAEDVFGYHVHDNARDDLIVCKNCVTDEELEAVKLPDIIVAAQVDNDEDWIFCDRCKERIRY